MANIFILLVLITVSYFFILSLLSNNGSKEEINDNHEELKSKEEIEETSENRKEFKSNEEVGETIVNSSNNQYNSIETKKSKNSFINNYHSEKIPMGISSFLSSLDEVLDPLSSVIFTYLNFRSSPKNNFYEKFIKIQIKGILIEYLFNIIYFDQAILSPWHFKIDLSTEKLYYEYHEKAKYSQIEKVKKLTNHFDSKTKKNYKEKYELIIDEIEESIMLHSQNKKMPISEFIKVKSVIDPKDKLKLYNERYYGLLVETLICYIAQKLMNSINPDEISFFFCIDCFFSINEFKRRLFNHFELV